MELDFAKLDRAFNPRCVAVVGDKERLHWIRAELTFKGKLYSVQISPESIRAIEALGVKNYTSLRDIPEPVDLAIIAVPRAAAPKVLEDCISKGVIAAHFFTAGFSETDTEEGRRLEKQLADRAREAGIYLIGPNCMGIFNPKVGLKQSEGQYMDVVGSVSFISQSGTHANAFASEAHAQGVDINKSVSFGNGTVLDSPDFLEYFDQDPGTKAIGMYLEGVRDGKRFISVLRRVAATKPVVIWKGGRTGEGKRAIASHTASLAVSHAVWRAAVKQCGAINVDTMQELIDTLKVLLQLPPVPGNRVGVIGGSGGQSVAIGDIFSEQGLEVPLLTPESYQKLSAFFSLVGASCRNPVDPGSANRNEMRRILEILAQDQNVDSVVVTFFPRSILVNRSPQELQNEIDPIIELRKKTPKPVVAVLPYDTYTLKDTEYSQYLVSKLAEGGISTLFTLERAARALKNASDYYRRKVNK